VRVQPELGGAGAEVDVVGEAHAGAVAHCAHWHDELLPLSDAHQVQVQRVVAHLLGFKSHHKADLHAGRDLALLQWLSIGVAGSRYFKEGCVWL
jgi:hypothetical protein